MSRKHHAIYSDPTGAAAAASPAKRRAPRAKGPESLASEISSSEPAGKARPGPIVDRAAVARVAYSYWEARGFTGGSPEEDWLRAEREVRSNLAAGIVS
jgi:hypothetical protein